MYVTSQGQEESDFTYLCKLGAGPGRWNCFFLSKRTRLLYLMKEVCERVGKDERVRRWEHEQTVSTPRCRHASTPWRNDTHRGVPSGSFSSRKLAPLKASEFLSSVTALPRGGRSPVLIFHFKISESYCVVKNFRNECLQRINVLSFTSR